MSAVQSLEVSNNRGVQKASFLFLNLSLAIIECQSGNTTFDSNSDSLTSLFYVGFNPELHLVAHKGEILFQRNKGSLLERQRNKTSPFTMTVSAKFLGFDSNDRLFQIEDSSKLNFTATQKIQLEKFQNISTLENSQLFFRAQQIEFRDNIYFLLMNRSTLEVDAE